jgi:hypothetical protein
MEQTKSKSGKASIYFSVAIIISTLASWWWSLTFIGSTQLLAGMAAFLAYAGCFILYIINVIIYKKYSAQHKYDALLQKERNLARVLIIVIPVIIFGSYFITGVIDSYNSRRETQDVNSTYDSTPFKD